VDTLSRLERLMSLLPPSSFQVPFEHGYFDADYFEKGTKSNYKPYGPGDWAPNLARMIVDYLGPRTVLDVGCAYGYLVQELVNRGVDACGFDISDYAISKSVVSSRTWWGMLENSLYWAFVDLVTCTEVLEHLVWYQIKRFFTNASFYADRVLALIATHKAEGDKDRSHITLMPLDWWNEVAECYGFRVDASASARFNEDPYSARMGWNGRFVVWKR